MNALTGHRSCAPEDCSGLVANPPQGPVPVSGVFPAGAALHLLETRLQAIRLSPYRADLPARHPVRLGMSYRFPGMLFSPGYPFGTGSAIRSRDISSRPCPLRGRYNSAPHGARRVGCAARSHIRVMRAFSAQPPSEPGVHPFDAPGSPAIYAVARPGWVDPAAFAENAQYHFGFLHCACLMVVNRSSPVPLRPVVRLSRSPDWADVTPPTNTGTPSP